MKSSKDRKQKEQSEEQKQQSRQDREKRPSEHNQDLLDEGIEETFPASDPPSVSHID